MLVIIEVGTVSYTHLQGGTVYTHQEVVARSKTLDELSFETEPDGPFITNLDTPYLESQKQVHGAVSYTHLMPVR